MTHPALLFSGLSSTAIELAIDALPAIAAELGKLNESLANGTAQLRTHHPLCITPKLDRDYSIEELDAMSKFLNSAIATGALVLPGEKKGGRS